MGRDRRARDYRRVHRSGPAGRIRPRDPAVAGRRAAGVRNIYSIRATATDLLEEQVRSFDLLNAVLREQRTITAIYSTIARRPEEIGSGPVVEATGRFR